MQNNKRFLILPGFWGFLVLGGILPGFPLWAQNGAQNVRKQGSWTKVSYRAKGSWRIVEQNGILELQLGEDFETTNAPDLNIILSPYAPDALTGRNALNDALTAGQLEGKSSWGKLKGPITLKLPAGLDLAKYQTIAIHCIAYSKLWVVSEL